MSGFHPRDFRRGLRHANLTDAEYRVAVEMCEYATIDQPEVWPSAAALADSCHMTTRAVIRIARRLEAKRLIARIAPSKGGRAKTNHWRLLETLTGGSGFSGAETLTDEALNPDPPSPETLTGGSGEVVKEVDRSRGARARAAEPPDRTAVPDPANAPPANLNGQQPNDPEPPRYCPRHMPDGTDDNCGPCGDARRAHDAWKEEQARRREADHKAKQAAIDACPRCDEKGWVDVDGAGTIVTHCDHQAVMPS